MQVVWEVAFLAVGVALGGFGIWLLVKLKVPRWAKGIWKWPLGDNLSPTVARLMGWSALLIGGACVPTAAVIAESDRIFALLAAMVAMLLIGAGIFPWIWGVFLSRSKVG